MDWRDRFKRDATFREMEEDVSAKDGAKALADNMNPKRKKRKNPYESDYEYEDY